MEEVGSTYTPPLIVYTANRPFTYFSNTSTYKMSYEDSEKLGIIQNGFAVSTRNNLTLDDEFRACIGCAILQRSRERLGMPLGDQCSKCFDEYCWDGSLNTDLNDVSVNFTEDGMTNDDESTNATSGASSSFGGLLNYGLISTWGFIASLLVVCLVGF
ncbi:unnamed protein product [Ambrosiozyma monospora]|uniref:Unnamed protein product n=1 Tax=Ambrosiozyma monospora TaxID=43982 RepID=A0ACB5TWG9_AMBMO|nr:unnamed protein product [Ambrosiozyma monospora]